MENMTLDDIPNVITKKDYEKGYTEEIPEDSSAIHPTSMEEMIELANKLDGELKAREVKMKVTGTIKVVSKKGDRPAGFMIDNTWFNEPELNSSICAGLQKGDRTTLEYHQNGNSRIIDSVIKESTQMPFKDANEYTPKNEFRTPDQIMRGEACEIAIQFPATLEDGEKFAICTDKIYRFIKTGEW